MRGRLLGTAVALLVVAIAMSGGPNPASGQAKPGAKKIDLAHITPPPESSAVAFKWMCEELTKRSGGAINAVFHGGTLLTKELEIMDAVKSGNIAMGAPSGAACTAFPEMCVFLTPYLVRDYHHAYAMFNGEIGKNLDETFQKKYKLKVLFFYDYDTVNGLGASAVPMPWGEVIPAAQQGVIDGADLPVVNINALKAYEVAKYASMTYHNYGPTVLVMNLDIWRGFPPEQQRLVSDVSREAQTKVREMTESVDNFQKAKEILEAKGMKVNQADVASFRKIAEEKIWPPYRQQYADMWDKIVNTR